MMKNMKSRPTVKKEQNKTLLLGLLYHYTTLKGHQDKFCVQF